MQVDPIAFSGGDVNLYRLVGNNPVNYIDPTGLEIQVVEKRIRDSGSGLLLDAEIDGSTPYADLIRDNVEATNLMLIPFGLKVKSFSLGAMSSESWTATAEYKTYTFEWDIKCTLETELKDIKLDVLELGWKNGEWDAFENYTLGQGKLLKVAKLEKKNNGATHRIIYVDSPGAAVIKKPRMKFDLAYHQTTGIKGVPGSIQVTHVYINYLIDFLSITGP